MRACVKKGFLDFFAGNGEGFDVFCVQETKMTKEQKEFELPGYHEYWNSAEKKGYSGTAVFSRKEPLSVSYGMGIPEHDTEGRIIALEFDGFYLVNVYTPNSRHGLVRLDYRIDWERCFRDYLKTLERRKPVIVCGDMNVAHKEIDIKNPKSNVKNPGFTPEERKEMTKLLDTGFVDTFRYFYPDKPDAYTWWSQRFGARERNVGWRIDYFLASEALSPLLEDARIYAGVTGSDHCPVGLVLKNIG